MDGSIGCEKDRQSIRPRYGSEMSDAPIKKPFLQRFNIWLRIMKQSPEMTNLRRDIDEKPQHAGTAEARAVTSISVAVGVFANEARRKELRRLTIVEERAYGGSAWNAVGWLVWPRHCTD